MKDLNKDVILGNPFLNPNKLLVNCEMGGLIHNLTGMDLTWMPTLKLTPPTLSSKKQREVKKKAEREGEKERRKGGRKKGRR